MSSRELSASAHVSRITRHLDDSNATPPHPYLAFRVNGYGENAQPKYTRPSAPRSCRLQEQRFQLPTPGDFRRAPVNPVVHHQLPSIRDLLHGLTGAGPLSTNIANSVAVNLFPTPLLPAPLSDQARRVPGQGSNNNDQNENPVDQPWAGKFVKKRYTGKDLILLGRAVPEEMPFLEPYGKKAAVWEAIKESVIDNGFSHSISADILRRKAEALVAYKKGPESHEIKLKTIAATLKDRTDVVPLGALLERMEDQWDQAKNTDQKKKIGLKETYDEDSVSGEGTRSISMRGVQRKRPRFHDGNAVEAEADADVPASGDTSTGYFADDENEDRHARSSKRRRLIDRSRTSEEMLLLYEEDIKLRQERDAANQKFMQKFIQRTDRRNRSIQVSLERLVALEVRRSEREEEEHNRKFEAVDSEDSESPEEGQDVIEESEFGYISQEL